MATSPGAAALSRETRVVRARDLFETEVSGEVVALNVESGACFGFNESASEVWRLIEVPRTLDQLIAELMARYSVDDETCLTDVSALLLTLESLGTVTLERAVT